MMNKNVEDLDPQARLLEIWRTLASRKLILIITTVVGLLGAWISAVFTAPQWEAVAIVQIGTVGQKDQLIEPVTKVVERMRLASFKAAVIRSLSTHAEKSKDASLYRESLAVRGIPATDLVQITVRGFSPVAAQTHVEATAKHLEEVHERVSQLAIREIQKQLDQIDAQLAQIETERQRMLKLASLRDGGTVEARFMESVMLTNMVMQQGNERRELERSRMKYADELSPLRTYHTKIIESVWVSEAPVLPNTRLILILALLASLLLGTVLALAIDFFQKSKIRSS